MISSSSHFPTPTFIQAPAMFIRQTLHQRRSNGYRGWCSRLPSKWSLPSSSKLVCQCLPRQSIAWPATPHLWEPSPLNSAASIRQACSQWFDDPEVEPWWTHQSDYDCRKLRQCLLLLVPCQLWPCPRGFFPIASSSVKSRLGPCWFCTLPWTWKIVLSLIIN